jgi:hypothetical protein
MEGNQFGLDFGCDIYCEDGQPTKIVYFSPTALQGMTVFFSKDGSFKIEKDGISASLSQESLTHAGLLLPARRLLLEGFSRSSVNTVQKLSEEVLLNITLPGESHSISFSIGKDGLPTVISGENFSYHVHFR